MLGITCALYDEAYELTRLLKRQKSESVYHYTGNIDDTPVSLFLTGPGLKKNKNKLQSWIEQNQITILLQTGFCGALTHKFTPGDICPVDKILSIHSPDEFYIANHGENHTLLTVDKQVFTMNERDDIQTRFNADLVDMEAWHICRILQEHFSSVKTKVIKIVGDIPGEDLLMESEVYMRSFFKEPKLVNRLKIAWKTGMPFFEIYRRKRILQNRLKSAVIEYIREIKKNDE